MPTANTETARVPEDVSGRPRRVPVGSISWRHTFRALRHRNYRLFFWGQLVSLVGTWMQQTAMSWFVYQITNSKLLLGVVAAIGSGPMMLSSIWGGSLADRHPKRSILLATQTDRTLRVTIGERAAPNRGQHHRTGSYCCDNTQKQL